VVVVVVDMVQVEQDLYPAQAVVLVEVVVLWELVLVRLLVEQEHQVKEILVEHQMVIPVAVVVGRILRAFLLQLLAMEALHFLVQ
jgi:hypothetical protein